ncbi:MFS transporter [Pseudorhodoferax sp.]|uniref:MFS transporter n=1 Tax=Pseudorhodoferax sp. TaxID=1993553 RepID=UPI0039E63456
MAEAPGAAMPAALAPLRHSGFAMLWSAWLLGCICMWMTDVAAAWLMTTLTSSKTLVALVQTASALPAFLLALPAGALADFVDKRRALLLSQFWMMLTAVTLASAAFFQALTPGTLLALVFCGGMGFAMRWPVAAALVPRAVPPADLAQAMALNAVAMNASRVAGPLMAGVLLAAWGGAGVFTLAAALWVTSSIVLACWRPQHAQPMPRRRTPLLRAMRSGLRYAYRNKALRAAMVRVWLLFTALAGLMGLLAPLAKLLGSTDATLYSTLFACLGLGAVFAAFALHGLRARTPLQVMVTRGPFVLAGAVLVAAVSPSAWSTAPALFVAGGTWLLVGNTLTVRAQLVLADRLRARGMAIFLMAVMAGSAMGAAVFGALADLAGVRASLLALAISTGAVHWLLRARLPIAAR